MEVPNNVWNQLKVNKKDTYVFIVNFEQISQRFYSSNHNIVDFKQMPLGWDKIRIEAQLRFTIN